MTTTFAGFTINGSPYALRGHDGSNGQTIVLQLEASPAPDIYTTRFYVGRKSKNAPPLVFSPLDGIAVTPTSPVQVTLPASGAHTYEILSEVNNGHDADGRLVPDWYASRFVAIRSTRARSLGRRKLLPAERNEYDPADGWTGELQQWADEQDPVSVDLPEHYFRLHTFDPDAAIELDYSEITPNIVIQTSGNPSITATNHESGKEYVISVANLGGAITWDSSVFRFGDFPNTDTISAGDVWIWTFRSMQDFLYCTSVHKGTYG